jgi:hypothetical protein
MSHAHIKPGTRVRVVRWSVSPGHHDDNITVPPGTEGTVDRYKGPDDVFGEQLLVFWDNGVQLAVLPRDQIEVVS